VGDYKKEVYLVHSSGCSGAAPDDGLYAGRITKWHWYHIETGSACVSPLFYEDTSIQLQGLCSDDFF
jgi:hypothetical protein